MQDFLQEEIEENDDLGLEIIDMSRPAPGAEKKEPKRPEVMVAATPAVAAASSLPQPILKTISPAIDFNLGAGSVLGTVPSIKLKVKR